MPSLLEAREVVAGYGDVVALHGLSITVGDGEVAAILGPNGAGKSTLLRTFSGVVKARSGEILLGGRPITGLAPFEIARLGIAHVPEGRRIFRDLSVEENLMVAGSRGRARASRREALDRAYQLFPRLAERRRQSGGNLSGGEQQMLAISRGLMQSPRILVLDEPSLGLAPVIVQLVYDALERLRADGLTILLVEQYAAMALRLADNVFVMVDGRVVGQGPASKFGDINALHQLYVLGGRPRG
jgi:branched-chain amino acid transport system ATP-binding protein